MKWINAKKQLPEDGRSVLVYTKYKVTEKAYLDFDQGHKPLKWTCFNDYNGKQRIEIDDVTHWMPLPKPPKEG